MAAAMLSGATVVLASRAATVGRPAAAASATRGMRCSRGSLRSGMPPTRVGGRSSLCLPEARWGRGAPPPPPPPARVAPMPQEAGVEDGRPPSEPRGTRPKGCRRGEGARGLLALPTSWAGTPRKGRAKLGDKEPCCPSGSTPKPGINRPGPSGSWKNVGPPMPMPTPLGWSSYPDGPSSPRDLTPVGPPSPNWVCCSRGDVDRTLLPCSRVPSLLR